MRSLTPLGMLTRPLMNTCHVLKTIDLFLTPGILSSSSRKAYKGRDMMSVHVVCVFCTTKTYLSDTRMHVPVVETGDRRLTSDLD